MRNHWLDRAKSLRLGKIVKYVGPDAMLQNKIGVVNNVSTDGKWVDVAFEGQTRILTVEKEYLEIHRKAA